jgi:penicillin-binding protein 1A
MVIGRAGHRRRENAFLMDDMLRDVVRRGTGRAALQLGRSDLAGKTGSTNDFADAWFAGYGGGVVAVAWVGHDQCAVTGPAGVWRPSSPADVD